MSQKTLRDREAKRLAQATQLVMTEGDSNPGSLNWDPKLFTPALSHTSSPTPCLASFGFRCCGRKKQPRCRGQRSDEAVGPPLT